jgi:hypothetical protein
MCRRTDLRVSERIREYDIQRQSKFGQAQSCIAKCITGAVSVLTIVQPSAFSLVPNSYSDIC